MPPQRGRLLAAGGSLDTSFQYIMKCDVYIRKEQYASLVLSSAKNECARVQLCIITVGAKCYDCSDVFLRLVRMACGNGLTYAEQYG